MSSTPSTMVLWPGISKKVLTTGKDGLSAVFFYFCKVCHEKEISPSAPVRLSPCGLSVLCFRGQQLWKIAGTGQRGSRSDLHGWEHQPGRENHHPGLSWQGH